MIWTFYNIHLNFGCRDFLTFFYLTFYEKENKADGYCLIIFSI